MELEILPAVIFSFIAGLVVGVGSLYGKDDKGYVSWVSRTVYRLYHEAKEHRKEYHRRASNLENGEAKEYWKGRRDEAGHFADQLSSNFRIEKQ